MQPVDPRVMLPPVQTFPNRMQMLTPQDIARLLLGQPAPPRRPGLLNAGPPERPVQQGGQGLLQPVGDVVQFPGKGLLHTPDLLQQQLNQQQGIPHMGGAALPPPVKPGEFGSKWRDPAAVEAYAAQQGIPPGLLAPVGKPPVQVTEHPTAKTNRLWDEGMQMSDARQAAMTVTKLSDLEKGAKVQMHPGTDTWMRGDRYGEVVGFNKAKDMFRVKLDASGRTIRVSPDNLLKQLPKDWMPPPREGASRTPWENMTPELWAKMPDVQKNVWRRDANYENWPATIRQAWRNKMGEGGGLLSTTPGVTINPAPVARPPGGFPPPAGTPLRGADMTSPSQNAPGFVNWLEKQGVHLPSLKGTEQQSLWKLYKQMFPSE